MAPLRRYLKISKHSVVECRIYLDNPSLAQSWLLNPRNPMLPRVMDSVRPLILPKLREEGERGRKKGGKKKVIKDVIVNDDFEVSMFLTETGTRHSMLVKHRRLRQDRAPMMQSNSTKLMAETNAGSLVNDSGTQDAPLVLEDPDSDSENIRLADIPMAPVAAEASRKRRRASSVLDEEGTVNQLHSSSSEANSETDDVEATPPVVDEGHGDDKKKLAMDLMYEGFAIYGNVVCLVVRKRGKEKHQSTAELAGGKKMVGQARMEN